HTGRASSFVVSDHRSTMAGTVLNTKAVPGWGPVARPTANDYHQQYLSSQKPQRILQPRPQQTELPDALAHRTTLAAQAHGGPRPAASVGNGRESLEALPR